MLQTHNPSIRANFCYKCFKTSRRNNYFPAEEIMTTPVVLFTLTSDVTPIDRCSKSQQRATCANDQLCLLICGMHSTLSSKCITWYHHTLNTTSRSLTGQTLSTIN